MDENVSGAFDEQEYIETGGGIMELKDLVGEHLLDAVDFSNEQVKGWGSEFENAQVMRFRLDGIVYTVTEDPSDGYRSSMREITAGDGEMTNIFSPIPVLGWHRAINKYGESENILELIDVLSGKVVVEVGTEDYDDFYPIFVANFQPGAILHFLQT